MRKISLSALFLCLALLGNCSYGAASADTRNQPFDGAICSLNISNTAASSAKVAEILSSAPAGTCTVTGNVIIQDSLSNSGVTVTLKNGDVAIATAITDGTGKYTLVAVPIGASYTVTGSKSYCTDVVNNVVADLTGAAEFSENAVATDIVLQQHAIPPVISFDARDYTVDQRPTEMLNKGTVPGVTDPTYFVNANGTLPTVKSILGVNGFDFSTAAGGVILRKGKNASDAQVDVSSIPGMGNDPSPITFTISAWLYRDDAGDGSADVSWLNWGSWNAFVDCHYGSPAHGWGWFIDLWSAGAGVSYNDIGGSPAYKQWHHVVIVQNQLSQRMDCYIDGVLKKTTEGLRSNTASWANTITVGAGWYGTFKGYICKFDFYNAALPYESLIPVISDGYCVIKGSVVMNGFGAACGVKVELLDGATVVATTGTDESGTYKFANIPVSDTYTVHASKPFCKSDTNDLAASPLTNTVYTVPAITLTQDYVDPAIVLDASKVFDPASIFNTGTAGGYFVAATAPAITKIPVVGFPYLINALNYAGTQGSYLRSGPATTDAPISPSAIPTLGADTANATFTISAWLYRASGGNGGDVSWLRWGRQWTGSDTTDPINALVQGNYGTAHNPGPGGDGNFGWGWIFDLWSAGSGISYDSIGGSPAFGLWHHIVVVQDKNKGPKGRVDFYVDGVLKGSTIGLQHSTGGTDMLFGSGNSGAFNGGIAEIVIYPAALSGWELADLLHPAIIEPPPPFDLDHIKKPGMNGADVIVCGTVTVVSKSSDCFFIADKNDYKGCVMVRLGMQTMPASKYLKNLEGTVSKDAFGQYTLTLNAPPDVATSGPAINAVGMNNRSALTDPLAFTNFVKVWGNVSDGIITDGYSSPITLIGVPPTKASGYQDLTGVLWRHADGTVALYCDNP